ncbi:hypothetical protein LINGRAHAP2_LOCUS14687 [Linum grandiflorum]
MTSRNVNLNIMRDRLALLWRPGQGMAVEDLGDKQCLFCFKFHPYPRSPMED